MNIVHLALLVAFVPVLATAAPGTEPARPAEALRLARAAYGELVRSQDEVLRRESERSACNLLGRLFALYPSRDEFVNVTVTKIDRDGKAVSSTAQVPVPRFSNANIDAIMICRPDSLWQRKTSVKALLAEIQRLQR